MSHGCFCMWRVCAPVPIHRALLKHSRPRSSFSCCNSHVVLGETDLCWVQHHRFLQRIDPSLLWCVCQIAMIIMGNNSSPSLSTFSKYSPIINELIIWTELAGRWPAGCVFVGRRLSGDLTSLDSWQLTFWYTSVYTQHHSQVSGTRALPVMGPGRKWFCLWYLPGTRIFFEKRRNAIKISRHLQCQCLQWAQVSQPKFCAFFSCSLKEQKCSSFSVFTRDRSFWWSLPEQWHIPMKRFSFTSLTWNLWKIHDLLWSETFPFHGLCLSDAFREAESKAQDQSQVTRISNSIIVATEKWGVKAHCNNAIGQSPHVSQLQSRREHLILDISSCAPTLGGRMGKVFLIFGFDLGTEGCLKGLSFY